jgi:hypothetical protein
VSTRNNLYLDIMKYIPADQKELRQRVTMLFNQMVTVGNKHVIDETIFPSSHVKLEELKMWTQQAQQHQAGFALVPYITQSWARVPLIDGCHSGFGSFLAQELTTTFTVLKPLSMTDPTYDPLKVMDEL